MPGSALILLIASIVIGVTLGVLSLFTTKYAAFTSKKVLKTRATALILLAFGFAVHIFGDYLVPFYGEETELAVESIAHVILLIGFIILAVAAKNIFKETQRYWFK